jgi:hypothetical protein
MYVGVKVSISMGAVLARLERMQNFARLKPLAKDSATVLERLYRKYTPVSSDPNQASAGRLKAGWESSVRAEDQNNRLLIQIRSRDPRAPLVWSLLQSGTRRHIIQALRGRALAFRLRDGGWFVGARVRHPGAKRSVDARSLGREVSSELTRLKKRIAEALTQDKNVGSG